MSNEKYICLECSCVYDPAKGDPKQGITPGISFEALPPTWRCPECGIYKIKAGVFKKLEPHHPKLPRKRSSRRS